MCEYQGHEFGASYPDSVCIDGYLWDADSGDAEGLSHGGDIPCPQCNHAQWLECQREEIMDDGWLAAESGGPRVCPVDRDRLRYQDDFDTIVTWWLLGYDNQATTG